MSQHNRRTVRSGHGSGSGRRMGGGHEEHEAHLVHDESNWLVSYADMMTLLFGFFVLMYAMSRVDQDKYIVVSKEVAKYFGGQSETNHQLTKLAHEVKALLAAENAADGIEISTSADGMVLVFDGALIFASGSAQLKPEMNDLMTKITQTVRAQEGLKAVRVEGHTDDEPIVSPTFPTNWELSAARATRVVRQFEAAGIAPERLEAEGFGSSRPLITNRDEKGNAIIENQLKNRRVVVNVTFGAQTTQAQKALESANFKLKEKGPSDPTASPIPEMNEPAMTAEETLKSRMEEAKVRMDAAQVKFKEAQELDKKRKELEQAERKVQELEAKVQTIEDQTKKMLQGPEASTGPQPASVAPTAPAAPAPGARK